MRSTAATIEEGDQRKRFARFTSENLSHNLEIVGQLETMAADNGCTIAQLSLAWLLAQGDDIIVISGTKKNERLEENLGALALDLTPADVAAISDTVPPGAGAGDRYPQSMMPNLNL